jgi:phosphoglycolate phosphatase-like HAD superfamily hydrolase
MSAQTLERRLHQASPQIQRQIRQFLETPEPQQQEVAAVLSEIKRRTPRGQFLAKLIHFGLAASEPITRWPDFDAQDDLSAVVEVLTQTEIMAELAPVDPLATHRLKGMLVKQQLLNYQGPPPLNSEQVAELLMMSREAVNKRRRSKQLIAVNLGKRGYRYPAWQFQEGKVLPGIKEVLKTLDAPGEWTPLLFLCSGDPSLNGVTPLEKLQAGEIDSVVAAARCYGKPNPA